MLVFLNGPYNKYGYFIREIIVLTNKAINTFKFPFICLEPLGTKNTMYIYHLLISYMLPFLRLISLVFRLKRTN